MHPRLIVWFPLIPLAACQASPFAADAPGALNVSWLVGPEGCESSGVVDVTVEVESDDDQVEDQHRCEEAGARFTGLEPGEYTVTLRGLDVHGTARYEGEIEDVEVEEDDLAVVPTVVLTALPAEITVTWFFENGKLCAHNAVEEIDFGVFDDGYLVANRVVDCDQGATRLGGLSAGAYVLDALGRDRDGFAVLDGQVDFEVDKGDLATLEVVLGAP